MARKHSVSKRNICPYFFWNVFRSILCCLVFAWVCVSKSHSSFFVTRRYREDKYYCVTNTSFAMSWIIETITEGLQQNSSYIPESRSSFNYDIKDDRNTKNYFIKHPWSLQSSSSEIILDERWEEMEVIKTEFVDGNNKLLKFVPVELSTANFDIALSIRIEREGHIFLCDGEHPSRSNCYWLMLEAFSGTGSAIRKCNKEKVPSKDKEYPHGPCSLRRVFVNHTLSQFPHYLFNSEWSHFVLTKADRKLTFSLHYDDNKIYKILEWQDTEAPIDVTHMIFHSKMVNGLWKIHNIDYIAATIHSNEVELGPPVFATEGFVCISMYVSMCRFCKLKLSLKRRNSIISDMIYEPKHTGWNQIKFITEDLSNDGTPMQLLVSTVSGDPSPSWAIDKIRFCRQEEFRKIGLTEEASCQLMSSKGNVITFQEQPAISDSNCPENTIGPFCVKCNLIFDNCEKTTICTKDGCVCSAGYYSTDCYYECSGWKYGHGCKKPCGKCNDKCNNIDGTCDHCTDEYSGPKCDLLPAPIESFIISSLTSSSVELKWSIPKLNGQFKEFVVEYQHISYTACGSNPARTSTKSRKTTTEASTVLTDLRPYSTYQISVFAVNTKFDGPPHTKQVNTSAANTVDLEEIPKIFNITSNQTAANLELSEINCDKIRGPITIKSTTKCISEWCTDQNREAKTEITYPPASLIRLYGLAAFSEYEVELKFCRGTRPCDFSEKKTFKTRPTVSGKVQNLLIYTKNETSISLRWKPRTPPTGILKIYKIVYSYFELVSRKREVYVQPVQCKLWHEFHCATLSDLNEGLQYRIEVSARNEDPADFGPSQETATLTKTEKSTAPYDLKVNWTEQNDLLLEWKHPIQTNGDIQYFNIAISLGKQQTSTKKLNITDGIYNLTYFYQINATEFTPTRIYKVSVFAFNGQTGSKASLSTTSPPDIPTLAEQPLPQNFNHTIGIPIFLNDLQGKTTTYRIMILRSDEETNVNSYKELQKLDLRNLRVVIDCNFTNINNQLFFILGRRQPSANCQDINNSPLEPATSYNVTIILMNTFNSTIRTKIYSLTIKTEGETNLTLLALFALLLLIPAVVVFYYIKRKAAETKSRDVHEFIKDDSVLSNGEAKTENMMLVPLQAKKKKNSFSKNAANIDEIPKGHLKLVTVKNFSNYFKTSLDNQDFKNQYGTILETKLVYETVIGDSLRSEYLDMNFNSGLQIKNAYLITKFPAMAEFNEFWKTILDESIDHIVLFAHLHPDQKKTKNYWPEVGKSLRCGDVIIECNMCQKYTFYIRRKFSLKCKNKIRKVDQLHLCLPQNDRRYLSSLNYVQFFLELLKIPLCSRTPILVHSSSGMRGNGFALLCDMSLRSAQKDGAIDVMAIFKTLVQTTPEMKIEFDHYVAAHAIIADTLNHLDTSIACNSFDCSKAELFTKREIQKHLKYLRDTLWLDQIVIEEENGCYVNCPTILLKSERRDVQISSDHHSQSEQPDFIKVGGFKTPGKFWVAKQPVSTPFSDFLEKVQERKISVIVTLNDNIFTWPNEDHPELTIGSDVTLKYKFIKKLKSYDWITLELTTKTTSQIVEVVTFKKWPAPVVSLPNVEDFVNFVKESNEIFQNTEPVLVTCHDGRTSCGLYLAMSYSVQQIKTENICDVCTCVRAIRRHCQHFIKDDEQYIFLVEAAHNYMKEFSLYEVR